MRGTQLSRTAAHALDRFITVLTDPARRERTTVIALAAYVVAWTLYGAIAQGDRDLHFDMTELVAWSRDLALGFPKHPPFAAMVVRGWFAVIPIADWTFYLLGILTAGLTLWIAWRLSSEYLSPTKSTVGLALLTFIPFFNFLALKFNVNTVLMPLWAITTCWFLRSYRTRSPNYAALAGVGAAFCMYSKYWSIFLLAGLLIAALSDSRRRAYFRSAAPWVTIAVGIAILSPHIGWLEKHDFSPMQYAMEAHGDRPLGFVLWHVQHYALGAIAYVSVPIAILLLVARPSWQTMLDMMWPADRDRRLMAVAFWATLVLPILPAMIWGVELHSIWTMSCWALLPVLLLSPRLVKIPRPDVRRIIGGAVVFPALMLLAAPGVSIADHALGTTPLSSHVQILAAQVERAWQTKTVKPLRYIGGNMAIADGVATYARSRPHVLPGLPQRDSWRLAESGMALICYADDPSYESDAVCRAASNRVAARNPASWKVETEIVRNYFGIAGRPQRYVIYIMPPQPAPP